MCGWALGVEPARCGNVHSAWSGRSRRQQIIDQLGMPSTVRADVGSSRVTCSQCTAMLRQQQGPIP